MASLLAFSGTRGYLFRRGLDSSSVAVLLVLCFPHVAGILVALAAVAAIVVGIFEFLLWVDNPVHGLIYLCVAAVAAAVLLFVFDNVRRAKKGAVAAAEEKASEGEEEEAKLAAPPEPQREEKISVTFHSREG